MMKFEGEFSLNAKVNVVQGPGTLSLDGLIYNFALSGGGILLKYAETLE